MGAERKTVTVVGKTGNTERRRIGLRSLLVFSIVRHCLLQQSLAASRTEVGSIRWPVTTALLPFSDQYAPPAWVGWIRRCLTESPRVGLIRGIETPWWMINSAAGTPASLLPG
jgi:hypothetical protein